MCEFPLDVIIDSQPAGLAELAALLRPGEEVMLVLSVPDCAPCAIIKALLDEEGMRSEMPAMRHDVTLEGGSHRDDRVTALLGKPLTMFPSVLLHSTCDNRYWLRGLGDKSGAWTPKRIADWIASCRKKDWGRSDLISVVQTPFPQQSSTRVAEMQA